MTDVAADVRDDQHDARADADSGATLVAFSSGTPATPTRSYQARHPTLLCWRPRLTMQGAITRLADMPSSSDSFRNCSFACVPPPYCSTVKPRIGHSSCPPMPITLPPDFLLKLDDQGLAHLAADRSMHAAQASEDPVTLGASARIVTHALMRGGHLSVAASTASGHAARLDRDMLSHSPESLSVYGSLLLRGAVAAAQDGRRGGAQELLDESGAAAQQLGADANLRWTAFGPTNVKLHRVNVAVTLGDAGTAVQLAREIDPATITVTERKATLLIDVSRAFLQWGRHDKAYAALRAAEHAAHEEVAGRPSVHRMVRELIAAAPPSVRRDAAEFATQIGVST